MKIIVTFVISILLACVSTGPARAEDGAAEFISGIGYNDVASGKLQAVNGWSHKMLILNDPVSPVQITSAKLYNLGPPHYSRYLKIPAWLAFIRADGKSVAAVQYGVLLYDSWNAPSGNMAAVDMHFESGRQGEWQKFQELIPSFQRFGKGCVFVSKVRMNGGRIWEVNVKHIASMMLKRGCGAQDRKQIEKAVRKQGKGSLRL